MWRRAAVGAAVVSVLTGLTLPGASATTLEPEQTGTLAWSVQSTAGGAAHGASFAVVDAAGDIVTVSDNDALDEDMAGGSLTVQLAVGTYLVNQVGAPEGLEVSGQAYTVQVFVDGQAPGAVVFVNEPVEVLEDEGADDVTDAGDQVHEGDQAQVDAELAVEASPEDVVVEVETEDVTVEQEADVPTGEDTQVDERAPPVQQDRADRVAAAAGPLQDGDPSCNPVPGEAGAFEQWHKAHPAAWTSGNAGPGYTEGEWVQQRTELHELAPGANQLVLAFDHQAKDGTAIGYDNVRFVRVTDLAGNPIQLDSIDVLVDTPSGAEVGTATLNFTLPEEAPSAIWLYFDVHLADSLTYFEQGLGGASYYPGSSLHTNRISLNCVDLGSSELAIPVNQMHWGTVTVEKVTIPAGDGTLFDFTISGADASTQFQLADGGFWSSQLGLHEFTVTEQDIPTGWALTDLTCTGTEAAYTATSATFTLLEDGDDVVCTFTNNRQWVDLTVTKTVETTYDRAYTWAIDKVAGSQRFQTPQGDSVTVDYDALVTAEDAVDSDITVSGGITVDNPNSIPFTVDVSDSLSGAECSVEGGGTSLSVPPGGATFAYTCTGAGDSVDTVGTVNTATVAWDAAGFPGTTGMATGTADVAFGDPVSEVDRYVTVTDAFDGGPAVQLLPDGQTLDWVQVAADGGRLIEYSQSIDGVPGTCTTYPNIASLIGDDDVVLDEDGAEVEVCVGMDLDIDKNVLLSLDRTYDYDLTKDVDQSRLNVDPETGEATFAYTVTVTDGPYADSNWVMTGQITVTNPNDWPVEATVTDGLVGADDATCTVTDAERAIPGAVDGRPGEAVFDYTCTFEGQPDYSGTNTATVTWDTQEYFSPSGEATGSADFELDDWEVTPVNGTVTVIDDKTDPDNPVTLGQHTWTAAGTETDYSYELTLPGVAGDCVDLTNTAWLAELPDVEDDAQVTVCWPLDLEVTKTVNAAFDREYLWDITKEVDQTEVTIDQDAVARFDYLVSATPDGYTDSGWVMDGQISVTNPNTYEEATVTVTVTDDSDVGGTCTVTDGTDAVLEPGQTEVFDYTCTFETQPDYQGTNTATVTWTGPEGQERTVTTDPVEVTFDLAQETNVEVEVYDDKVTLEAPGELLGTANWHEGTTEFTYTLELEGLPGECTSYTNTALIPATDDQDQQTVTVCVPAPPLVPELPVTPQPPQVAPLPPVIPTGDPVGDVSGGLLAAGIAAMLLALLGARVALGGPRR